jgi:uncharacterized protein with HEPN domain
MQPRDAASLLDMLESARAVVTYVGQASYEEYLANDMLRAAVERRIEVIGEAARRVSDEFKRSTPQVPWQIIIARRHIIAHNYDRLANDKIFRVATTHVPTLIVALAPLIPTPPPDPLPEP